MSARKNSTRQQIAEYLSKNTETSFAALQGAFPGTKKTSLRTYMSLWKKEQKTQKRNKPVKKTKLEKPIAQKVKANKKGDDTQLIESLKKTIAAQQKTIQDMSRSIQQLGSESNEKELKGMTFSEIKKIAVTYLKSIKELPANLKR